MIIDKSWSPVSFKVLKNHASNDLKNVVPSNFGQMVRAVLFAVMCHVWACELG